VKKQLISLALLFVIKFSVGQEVSLDYFLNAAEKNNPVLLQNKNLEQIGNFENQLINAQNSFQVDITSEVMVAPYFNNYGRGLDITTNPSPNAYGYAKPVSNGALYSAQLNITKDIFNRSKVQNLLFQNKFPEAQNVTWEMEEENVWEAEFNFDGKYYFANFTNDDDEEDVADSEDDDL